MIIPITRLNYIQSINLPRIPVGVGMTIVDDVSVVEGIGDEESKDPLLISIKIEKT